MNLPKWGVSFQNIDEKKAVTTRDIGVNIAVKTGPFISITHALSQYDTPVTNTPCQFSTKFTTHINKENLKKKI